MSEPRARDISSSEEERSRAASDHPEYERVRRRVMRIGNAIFISIGLIVFVPMMIGVGRGVADGRIWDPNTDRLLSARGDCEARARRLTRRAVERADPFRVWEASYRQWRTQCARQSEGAAAALTEVREAYRGATLPGAR